jgi:hypothetical protein
MPLKTLGPIGPRAVGERVNQFTSAAYLDTMTYVAYVKKLHSEGSKIL